MKKQYTPTLADSICNPRTRKIKKQFFKQLTTLIDWQQIQSMINDYDQRGRKSVGNLAHDGLVLFKMCLLQTWYGLSDYEIEDQVNDRLSFSSFCGLSIDSVAPDHSTLSRFRSSMSQLGVYEKLLQLINDELEKHQFLVKQGAIVDASVIPTPLKPKGKPTYVHVDEPTDNTAIDVASKPLKQPIAQKTNQQDPKSCKTTTAINQSATALKRVVSQGVDQQATWLKKGNKAYYGYKKHVITNQEGLVLGLVTTPANVHEITNLEKVLSTTSLPENIPIKADKGYSSKKNRDLLKTSKLQDHIMHKATPKQPLSDEQLKLNRLISKTRYKIERTFGSIKRWFHAGVARYKGINKMHTQNLLEAISYNLYRIPGIIMSNKQ